MAKKKTITKKKATKIEAEPEPEPAVKRPSIQDQLDDHEARLNALE